MILQIFRRAFCLLVLGLVAASASEATTVLPLSLEGLTRQAGLVFVGRCESTEAELDENGLPATHVRFRVEEGLKGTADGGTVWIKQFGVSRPPLKVKEGESAVVPLKTMAATGPFYRTGASYLLFLYPESKLGFTSPVGGGQGRFEIEGSGASALAVNPFQNRFLKTFREGPVALEKLVSEIKQRIEP